MQLTLSFDGQPLGEVEVGPPNEQGLRAGTLRPNATYHTVRPRLQQPMLGLLGLQGASAEQIRAHLVRTHAELAADGLMLLDAAGTQVAISFLQVVDMFPLDTEPAVLEFTGVQIGVRFAPGT